MSPDEAGNALQRALGARHLAPTTAATDARAANSRNSQDARSQRPRHTLAGRAMRWMLLLALLPVLICTVLFNFTANDYLRRKYNQDAQTLGQVIAASLANRLDSFVGDPDALLSGIGRDPRIAFICVTDAKGKLLHAGVYDNQAWSQFDSGNLKNIQQQVSSGQSFADSFSSQTILRTVPIIGDRTAGAHTAKELQGYLVLAMRDLEFRQAILKFQMTQIATVIGVVLVALPLVALFLSRWTRPWRELMDATRRLAQGDHIEPLIVRSEDEVGVLSMAFNDMAAKLLQHQRELEEINTALDHKVKQRTVELQQKNEQLEQVARTDALTGLANRRAFAEAMHQSFPRARMRNSDLCVLVVDLDGFKQVNDTCGHDKGDELLQLASDAMRRHASPHHLPARMGGDEFLLMMPDTPLHDAAAVANRIRDDFIRQSHAMLGPSSKLSVSMSQGLANIRQTSPTTSVELIAQADKALYAAKSAGKNCLVVFDPVHQPLAA